MMSTTPQAADLGKVCMKIVLRVKPVVEQFRNKCWVQTHVLECILSHCVIYKSKLSWMCLPSFTSRHVFAVWYKNHCKNETKTWTCRERQSWCSLHVEVFVSYLQWFLYQLAKIWHDVIVWSHIQLCLDLYLTQWDNVRDSKTCVWTQNKIGCLFVSISMFRKEEEWTLLDFISEKNSQRSATANCIDNRHRSHQQYCPLSQRAFTDVLLIWQLVNATTTQAVSSGTGSIYITA